MKRRAFKKARVHYIRSCFEDLLLLGGGFFSCWLLSGRLLGGLGLLSGSLLSSWLLSGGFLGGLLSCGLLGDLLLGCGLLGSELERSSSLLSGGCSGDEGLGVDHLLEGESGPGHGLGGVDLVVGADVLEDGLSGGS